jgi:protein ImuA
VIAMIIYMNASRLQQFSCVPTDRMGCSSISGLVAAGPAAAGPYEIR